MAIVAPITGDIVSFQLVDNVILGGDRVQVRVLVGDMDYQAARVMDNQLDSKHANLFPYFKDTVGGVDDPANYRYGAFLSASGGIDVLGLPWIKPSTYRTVVTRINDIQISNWREEFRGPFLTFMANLGASYTMNIRDN